MNQTQGSIREYLKSEFTNLSKIINLAEWIDCHVERTSPHATLQIVQEIERFIAN